MTTTEYSVSAVEAKSSIRVFLDPNPYIRSPKPHLNHPCNKTK